MLFPRLAQFATALLLLTIGLDAPAHAQNNKQIISGTWYEDRATPNAYATGSVGYLYFAQTPSDKFLNITDISCDIEVAPNQAVSKVILNVGSTYGNSDLQRPYYIKGVTTPETVGAAKYYSIVTNQIFYKFGPGRYPSIEIDTASADTYSMIARCVIVGNLTDD